MINTLGHKSSLHLGNHIQFTQLLILFDLYQCILMVIKLLKQYNPPVNEQQPVKLC